MAKEREAWDRFLATGKVEDYLACVKKRDYQTVETNKADMKSEPDKTAGFKEDGRNHAGFC